MDKRFSIIGGLRPSMLGDCIASLPFLNLLERKFPGSYKTAFIDKKCSQITPFLINHPLIDEIIISEVSDKISDKDIEIFNKYDLKFYPFPPVKNFQYYNFHNLQDELTYMQTPSGYITQLEIYDLWAGMTELEKSPVLNQYFSVPKLDNTIAIWPFSGYSLDDSSTLKRSPNINWWNSLIELLENLNFQVRYYGHPKIPKIGSDKTVFRDLNLFDAIKETLGCSLSISTDSGSSHLINAYGAKNITLYTNYLPNHNNLEMKGAMLPKNWNNNLISIFGKDNINNINIESVLEEVKTLTT